MVVGDGVEECEEFLAAFLCAEPAGQLPLSWP